MKEEQIYNYTADMKFLELCEEIDHWKAEAKYWKEEAEKLRTEQIEESGRQLKQAQQGVANALMFALSVEDKPDGSISISKENRKELAKNLGK